MFSRRSFLRESVLAARWVRAAVGIFLVGSVRTVWAQGGIVDAIQTQGAVLFSVSGTLIPVATEPVTFPVSLAVSATTTFPDAYQVVASVGTQGSNLYQSGLAVPALIELSNNAGGVSGTSSAVIEFTNAPGAYPDQISNGALRIIGAPAFYHSGSTNIQAIGGAVSWTNTGTITVAGSGALMNSGPLYGETGMIASGSLSPGGFRTAQLSGLVAFSYGDQGTNHSHTWPGGNVTVTSSGAIVMTNANSSQITAGISAGTAAGPASSNPDFPDPVSPPPTVSVTLDGGTITNTADAALGVMASATGAQFLHGQNGDSDTAYGGNVAVDLAGNASIALTGTTGVGVFAVSEVYSVKDSPKDSTVQSGTVGVVIGQGASITTGTTGSLFSIGVLAVGAGSDLFLSPFTAQHVDGHGVGDAGVVTITNSGAVTATGTLSAGLVGLSIGGPGIVTTNSGTSPNSTLGNSGGSTDGTGDAVTITNQGSVATVGANAYGVVALSSGGGGLLNNEIAAAQGAGLVVGNASSASGSSSDGGSIQVMNSGTILTGDGTGAGVASVGVVAQSIGGAGGNAGGNHAALFVGDAGGAGGMGGAVDVTLNSGSLLRTQDQNSLGVLAQSIGGGGGNGGNAKGLFVAVGGKGGAGGDGGAVDVEVSGSLNTLADHSTGVMAQSLGGGGGHGGSATEIGAGVGFGIGGNGGQGGHGRGVIGMVGVGGALTTLGNNSTAMHLMSVGGGGGSGGAASSYTLPVGDDGAHLAIALAVGGSGGEGGTGGVISGTNAGVITTGVQLSGTLAGIGRPDGADSYGMLAQSVGGGGGHGGLATAKTLSFRLSGSGAIADTTTGSTTLGVTLGATAGVGGSGGKGVDGGSVNLSNLGSVTTLSDGSHAMIAQSVGGGGGTGGDSTATSTLGARSGLVSSLNLAIGGAGGKAGGGGAVSLVNSGSAASVHTVGQDSSGVVAQSIGGGGGIGGIGNGNLHSPYSGTSVGSGATADVLALTLSLGGKGGGGGSAGPSEVNNAGTILTEGSNARGIVAQSIGGGGGLGGGGSTDGSNNKITIDLSLGGSGGAAGSASGTNSLGYSVAVSNTGTISTSGATGSGILAQSIGGGGGAGGNADAQAGVGAVGSITNLLFSATSYSSQLTLGTAIGGDGGGGGRAGAVMVDQAGTISTQGFQAMGVVAQSISGGGGQGGSATVATNPGLFDVLDGVLQFGAVVAVGGKGGDGHDGGTVDVQLAGQTTTGGYGAHAVVAQSIAGGGGHGADGTADVTSSLGLGARVGNVSGTMGAGGAVTVIQTANIATTGGDASGIVAQSISAGGGIASTGQDRHLLSVTPSVGVLPLHLDFTLGVNLSSDDSADGGGVTIQSGTSTQLSAPQIQTQGDLSQGLVAQSIGAGGGKASSIFGTDSTAYADFSSTITQVVSGSTMTSGRGIALGAVDGHGAGGTITINLLNTVITTGVSGSTGYGSSGILAQSIGGGGGLATVDTAAANGLVWLGGTSTASGVGGHGGAVNFTGGGTVTTRGDAAHGAVLQSIGGGGGVALIGSSREFSGSAAPTGLAVDLTLGSRDSSGSGQAVTSSAALTIQTFGDNAFGLLAQSIGGGGGIATAQQDGAMALGMQAAGSGSSDGGTVSVATESSTIVTLGDGSHGVVAQSIGGGGGIANPSASGGLTTTPSVVNSGTALGYGGAVDVNVTGSIQTSGAGAFGVIAQSISGGGGIAGSFAGSTGGAHSSGVSNSGTAGNVTVELGAGGLISASGTSAAAIFAQNDTAGSHGAGSVVLTIGGTVSGGSGLQGAGIWVDGGNAGNGITVGGGGRVSAASKNAITYSGAASVDVANNGIVQGAISLSGTGSAVGTFHNNPDGAFFAEGDIRGNVSNAGSFVVGIDNTQAATATLFNAYATPSSADATVDFDAFSVSNYDQILFSGDAAGSFEGNVGVTLSDTYAAAVGDTFYLIQPGTGLDNVYQFDSYQITYQGQTVLSLDGTPMEVAGVRFSFLVIEPFLPDANSFILTVTAVPEPGTILLVFLGGCGLFLRRRRLGSY